MSEASKIFSGTAVNITSHGRPYLGSPIGSQSYVKEFVLEKVGEWKDELLQLCQWARTQPHEAFTAYTLAAWCSIWSFLTRTCPDICHLLKEIEDIIRVNLLPSLTGRPPLNDIERDLLSLPGWLGGIGIVNPSKCNHNFSRIHENNRTLTESDIILFTSIFHRDHLTTASEQTGCPKTDTGWSKVTPRGDQDVLISHLTQSH